MLLTDSQWFKGPEFLWSRTILASVQESRFRQTLKSSELIVITFLSDAQKVAKHSKLSKTSVVRALFDRHSIWKRLKSSVACMLRAVHRFKCVERKMSDVPRRAREEYGEAEDLILAVAVAQECFNGDN